MKIMSITSRTYAEQFGFTPEEVEQILRDYGFEDNLETVKQWYDGYRFIGLERARYIIHGV